jgi:hypothetical protein
MQKNIKIQAAKLYAFADGNIFSNENFAKSHQLHSKMQYVVFRPTDVSIVEPEKPTKTDKKKSETASPSNGQIKTMEDQLLEMDLTKPDGKMYKTYKALADGLGVKRENNKLETILDSLVEAQKKLTNKSQE